MQFKTYLTSLKTMYFLKPGSYDAGERCQLKDDTTGKPIFYKEVKDADGNISYEITLEDTGLRVMGSQKSYMEGIFWTFTEIFGNIRDPKTLWKKTLQILQDPIKSANLKMLLYQFVGMALAKELIEFLLGLWGEKRDEDKSKYTIGRAIGDEGYYLLSKSLVDSTRDFNILRAFSQSAENLSPVSLVTTFRMVSSFWNLSTDWYDGEDNYSFDKFLKQNFGAFRSVDSLYQGVKKTNAAVVNTVN